MNITASGVTLFDPVAMNLNPVVPGIFNFTTINVASGSTLKFTENKYHGAVIFLASGDVTISGVLDLSGDNGHSPVSFASQRIPNAAGSGGFAGGVGGNATTATPPQAGNGPNAPSPSTSGSANVGGPFTGNQFLVPLVGGSGGAGGTYDGTYGGGGGAGGGAILLAGSTNIQINGQILAKGGSLGGRGAGSGAGGAVRLVSNTISGGGSVNVAGGPQSGCCGGDPFTGGANGLVRFEANSRSGVGVTGNQTQSTPFALNLPTTAPPSIAVSSINGQPITSNPFSFPDITINSSTQVPIVVQAANVPVATAVVKIYIFSETGPDQVITVGGLTGTNASSTATANITYPPGGSRGFVKATW